MKQFFKPEVLNTAELESTFNGFNCMAANYNNLLFSSEIKTNFIRNVQFGNTTDETGSSVPIYQIVLDIDSYVDSITPEIIANSKSIDDIITKINNTTFSLYKNSLTLEFFEKLKDRNYVESDFKGII